MGSDAESRGVPVARPAGAPPCEIVALASSAGGLAALTSVLSGLPRDFPAPVVLVQHLDPSHRSLLADMLSRRTPLSVKMAEEGDRLSGGWVFIAPPDHHLAVRPEGSLSLTKGHPVHFLRPAANVLFESVAAAFGDRALAVVLTGTGSDGSAGVRAIKRMGGMVIAQDAATSEFFGMPKAAIESGSVDFILPLDEIAPALTTLVRPLTAPAGTA